MENLNLEQLKQQANVLGIKYGPNISAELLQKKIDEKLAEERVNKRVEVLSPESKKRSDIIKKAMKRSKVIIYNNDPKEADFSTVYSSVRNSFFGDARVIPLGIEWWVPQMHIDHLSSIEMIRYVKDPNGNTKAEKGKKFTIDIIETDEEEAKRRLAKQATS